MYRKILKGKSLKFKAGSGAADNFIIVSFYTKNTGYEKEIRQRLLPSLLRWRLPFDIEGIRSKGSWKKNCMHKPAFIRKMMDKHPGKNIIWIDADAVIHKYPKLFKEIHADIAVHYIDWVKYYKGRHEIEMNSAVVFFKNNRTARKVVDDWKDYVKKHGPVLWGDQGALQVILEGHRQRGNIVVQDLPPEYCKIFKLMKQVRDPVIEQFQASQRLRLVVDNLRSRKTIERLAGGIG